MNGGVGDMTRKVSASGQQGKTDLGTGWNVPPVAHLKGAPALAILCHHLSQLAQDREAVNEQT